ncbi:MAG: acyltransferase [Promethearchaeota archaeon]
MDYKLYGNPNIGKGVIIQDNVVIGKRPERASISHFKKAGGEDTFPPTVIGDYVTICTGAVIYAGTTIGNNAFIGDNANIRENSSVGENTIIGRNVTVECNTRIGKNSKIQTAAHITGDCTIGDGVFIGPEACTMNDKYMGLVEEQQMSGPIFEDGCAVGGNATILPGIRIGKNAIVGAGSVVTKDVPEKEVWVGNPAKKIKDRDI